MSPFDFQTLLFSQKIAAEFVGKFESMVQGIVTPVILIIGAVIYFWARGLNHLIWIKKQGQRTPLKQVFAFLGFLTMLTWALFGLVWVLLTGDI